MKKYRTVTVIWIFMLFLIPPASADLDEQPTFHTEIDYIYLDDMMMVNVSDLIARGHVKEISSSWWNTSDGREPAKEEMLSYSLFHGVVITLDEIYKGETSEKEIVILQYGGTLGNIVWTSSEQQYNTGDEVIVYLIASEDTDYYYDIGGEHFVVVGDNSAVDRRGQQINLQEDVLSKIDTWNALYKDKDSKTPKNSEITPENSILRYGVIVLLFLMFLAVVVLLAKKKTK